MRLGLRGTALGCALAVMLVSASAAHASWHELIGGTNPVNVSATGNGGDPSMITVNGVLWIAWSEYEGGNRKIHVAKLNAAGTDWVEVGGALNHAPAANAASPRLALIGSVPYVTWVENDDTNYEVRVAKLNAAGDGWDEIDGGAPANPINHNATEGAGSPSLADIGGVPYVAWSEEVGTGLNQAQVWVDKLSGGAWTQVGGSSPLNYDPNEQANAPVMAAIGGAPYVAWSEGYGNGQMHVVTLNGDGTGWTQLGAGASPINHDPARGAYRPDLIGIGGVPYVAWNEEVTGNPLEVYVSSWDGSAWNHVGSGSSPVSGGGASPAYGPSLAAIGGVPYVAESEYNSRQEIFVKRFSGGSWGTVDAASTPINGAYDSDGLTPELVASSGAPVVAWSQDESTSMQVRVSADDGPLSFSSATYSASESAGTVNITVQRSGGAGQATVHYATSDGTAHQPGDYGASSGTLTFAPGETSKTFPVSIVGDTGPEPDETVNLTLSSPGGTGELGTPATATLTITDDDTVNTQIDSGPSGATNDNTPTFTFSADKPSSTFDCGLDTIQIANYTPCTSPKTYGTPLADGAHTFAVFATAPGAGTDSTPAARDFFVDTHAPATSISIQPYQNQGQKLGNGKFAGTVQIAGHPADPAPSSGAGASRCALDPATPPAAFGDMTQPCTSPNGWVVTPAPGPHTIYSASRDPAANNGQVISTTFTIASPPNTTITAGPTGVSWTKTPTFQFSSDIPGSTFKCRLDGAPVNCTSPYTVTTPLDQGGHRFQVSAVSPEGAEDPTPAERIFTIGRLETHAYSCAMNPFHLHPYPESSQKTDDCLVIPTGQACSNDDHNCAYAGERCPVGAECSLTSSVDFYDPQDTQDWLVQTWVKLGTPADYLKPFVNRGVAFGPICEPNDLGHQCNTGAQVKVIGDGDAPSAMCGAVSAVGLILNGSGFGPDSARSAYCHVTFTIKPAVALGTVANGTTGAAFAPGAGTVTVAPGGGSAKGAARQLASKGGHKKAFKTVHKKAKAAGRVDFKLKLSKKAKKAYKRKGRLTVSLKLKFEPKKRGAKTLHRTQKLTLVAPEKAPDTPVP